MSQYASTEDMEMDQIASNSGWSEFCEWALRSDGSELGHLVSKGWANDFPALIDEISEALESDEPSDDVADIAKGVLDFLESHDGAEMIAVSNGVVAGDRDSERSMAMQVLADIKLLTAERQADVSIGRLGQRAS